MSEVRTRAQVHEWILTQVRQRPGCQDFSQEFRLLGNGPNWECIPTNCYNWDRASLEAFDRVVGDATEIRTPRLATTSPLPVAVTRFPSNAICGSPCSGSCISTRIPVIVTGEAPLSPDRS